MTSNHQHKSLGIESQQDKGQSPAKINTDRGMLSFLNCKMFIHSDLRYMYKLIDDKPLDQRALC